LTFYRLCDFLIESNVILSGLLAAGKADTRQTFRLRPVRPSFLVIDNWLRHQKLPDGTEWLSVARLKGEYLLRFTNLADFTVSADGWQINCYPHGNIVNETASHLLLDQVIPAVLAHQGELVLHASGVVSDYGAIAFLGESGSGKSTLCAGFNRAGFPQLSDDFLLLRASKDGFVAVPSYPGLRLWPDSRTALKWEAADTTPVAHYTTKERLDTSSHGLPFCSVPVPITTLFVLTSPDETMKTDQVSIEPLTHQDAFMALLKYSFRLDISDRERNKKAFRDIAETVSKLKLFRLSYPRKMAMLPQVRTAILEHLATEERAMEK